MPGVGHWTFRTTTSSDRLRTLPESCLDNGYTEELINEALKEAVYNNVTSLKYIDKILEAWDKKGIKTKEDVAAEKKKFKERKQVKNDSFYYDWLNDEE